MENAKIKGWSYRVYPNGIESSEFGPFKHLIDLWQTKSGNNAFPTWRDFELEDFSMWWGRLSLATVLKDPLDIKFVLWGTTLTDWWGIDFTNKDMENVYENRKENWENFEGPYLQALLDAKGVGLVEGDLRVIDRDFLTVQGIDLPLLKDGALSQILSAYCIIDAGDKSGPCHTPLWKR